MFSFVIFGATGDLTQRKILPAFYNLAYENFLPDFVLIAIGRRSYTNEEFHKNTYQAIKDHSRFPIKESVWEKLKSRIYYYQMDFVDENKYCQLEIDLQKYESKHLLQKRIYYLAVSPEHFIKIVDNLNLHCMKKGQRLVIEKPFGRNLVSAKKLNAKIESVFGEENIYRIDHYLGKEMMQNIMVIRFANSLFEPIWNSKYIKQVQITSYETQGIGSRGNYYDKAGATRDMAQSHLLQLLCLIAMDKPKDLNPQTIRDEKVKVLKALKKYSVKDVDKYVVRGQYNSYREEKNVDDNSSTETFVAFKTLINNRRWQGVPFYIRTGKKMAYKTTEIIVEFKQTSSSLYNTKELFPNYLVIKIQPREGIFFQFNAKKPGTNPEIVPVKMDFCQNCQVGINSPEAYERLLLDVIKGDNTLFARWDEVEYSWKFIDQIIMAWNLLNPRFPNYTDGSLGPKISDRLVEDNKWIKLEDDYENI